MDINWNYFLQGFDKLPESIIAAVGVYILVLLYTQIFGLKSFSKMTGFDFLNTLAIGNLLAMSIATAKPGPLLGALIIGVLYLFNYLITLARYRSKNIEEAIDNSPILLMQDGKLLHKNLERTKITEAELRGKLREANALQLSHVKAVILETTGDVSVLHTSENISVDDYILDGVES
ncbi:DUF421 domain-containing protein [Dokdonia sp. Hel_I_53]|uniref:DUF421 domain-containing protein n=1 Tax=Dokdonia sp. Hel_I_53 TaxID=1566287 RepID=UPI0011990E65|nr:YetF domain-containing protein [Dokdonia sp. Hel_I_53]TVZ52484.1 uncharacterized protein DUF421 [Dokdonia sp. Hel_I_53]